MVALKDIARVVNGLSLVAKEAIAPRRLDALIKGAILSATDVAGLTKGNIRTLDIPRAHSDDNNYSTNHGDAGSSIVYFDNQNRNDNAKDESPGEASEAPPTPVADSALPLPAPSSSNPDSHSHSEIAAPSTSTRPPAPAPAPAPAPSKIQGKYETLVDTFKKNSSSSGFRANRSVYKNTVHRLARAGQFSHIDDILQYQKQYPDIKNEYFTTRLIILYGQAKMLDHALQLFDEMPHINCPRTVLSFNCLLAACFPSENLDKVIELFHKLPTELSIEPDVISYNSAIKAFCKKGLFDNAVSLLEEMAAKGVAPNAVTFEFLLIECYHGGMFSEAENAWRLMKEKNVEPNLRCYNSRIQGLVSEKRLSEAIETVKELEQKGLQGCSYTYTYNLLIKGFITEGNAEEVKKWYAALQESSAANAATAPNIFTYVALVPFALDHIGIDFAYQLCKDAVGIKGKLSSTIVKKVIDELLKQSKLHQAQELQQLHKFTVSNA